MISVRRLRNEIVLSALLQGFRVNPHLRPVSSSKSTLRQLHQTRRIEQITAHAARLKETFGEIKQFKLDGDELRPEKIRLRLIEIKHGSLEERIYFWWNLIWWSVPYEPPIGRQLRFLLWDDGHNAPFGLLGLQSPPLHFGVRDRFLELPQPSLDFWVNQSLSAQRIGALPPYNMILGSKMVALAASSADIRHAYETKYAPRKNSKPRTLPSRLLFVTTSSAYGRSSVYERLSYRREEVCSFIGLTAGAGTFQIPERLYQKILVFLRERGNDVDRNAFRKGPSRKLRLIDKALDMMNLKFSYHNVRRGVYLFPHASNLSDVLSLNKEPIWYNRPFDQLASYWRLRWCLPRAQRIREWKSFQSRGVYARASRLLSVN